MDGGQSLTTLPSFPVYGSLYLIRSLPHSPFPFGGPRPSRSENKLSPLVERAARDCPPSLRALLYFLSDLTSPTPFVFT